jgi:aspartate 1-decarboxylase
MELRMLKAKIHGAVVTGARIEYEGSVTVDRALMRATGMLPYEAVQIWSISTGERLETYLMEGEEGSGVVCVNGAAAHRIKKGERIILACFCNMDAGIARSHKPAVIFVDEENRIVASREETAGQARGAPHQAGLVP